MSLRDLTSEQFIATCLEHADQSVVAAARWAHQQAGWERPTVEQLLEAARLYDVHPFAVMPWAGFAPMCGPPIDRWSADGYVDLARPGAVGRPPANFDGSLGHTCWLLNGHAPILLRDVH